MISIYICVLESKNQIEKTEFQKKVDRLRYKLAVKEQSCTCPTDYDSRASNVQNNLKNLEENMTELKHLLSLLENNIEVSPTKYGNLYSFLVFICIPVDTFNFILKLRYTIRKKYLYLIIYNKCNDYV